MSNVRHCSGTRLIRLNSTVFVYREIQVYYPASYLLSHFLTGYEPCCSLKESRTLPLKFPQHSSHTLRHSRWHPRLLSRPRTPSQHDERKRKRSYYGQYYCCSAPPCRGVPRTIRTRRNLSIGQPSDCRRGPPYAPPSVRHPKVFWD